MTIRSKVGPDRKSIRGTFRVLPFLLLMVSRAAWTLDAADPLAERMTALTRELRCLVCQNQTLADSDAELAIDLRQEIHEMMLSGKSDAEIVEFLVNRYGDFVRYRPPVDRRTALLWAAPAVLAVAGLWSLLMALRRIQRQQPVGDVPVAGDEESVNSIGSRGA
jgi:cytochrome c-type biogenesis protein CcmH